MGEYEVESILRAKVVGKPRGKKAWSYWVKWKNYGIADNTWEPAESFNGGSEHFIEHFWSRVETKGRDYNNLHEFSVDEEFFPAGPPRRKKAKKAKGDEDIPATPPTADPGDSEKEVRSIIGDDEEPSISTRGSKRGRSSVGEGGGSEATAPKRKRGPPGIPATELAEEEAVKKRGRPPGIPAVVIAEEVAVKKRGRPPGIPASGMAAEKSTVAVRTARSKRSRPNLRENSSPGRDATMAGTDQSSPSRRPLPRTRGRPSTSRTPRRVSPSPDELLFDSEDNGQGRTRRNRNGGNPPAQDVMDVDESTAEAPSPFGAPALLNPQPEPDVLSEAPPATPSIPAHRLRAANPRVKMIDDPHLTEMSGAIAVKAKFMKRGVEPNEQASSSANNDASARASRSRAGPGRSSSGLIVGGSRLTAQKGKLTTVRLRKARKPDQVFQQNQDADVEVAENLEVIQLNSEPVLPPTGQELLSAAGLNATVAGDLPDFEEDAEGEVDPDYVAKTPEETDSPVQNLEIVEDDHTSQAPAVVLEARPVTFAKRITTAWNESTIFGPLALGLTGFRSQNQTESSTSSPESKRYTIHLNLDPAVSIPVTLKDVHASQPLLDGLDSMARSPGGKFYKDQHATTLVGTLRAQESYARVTLSEGSSDEQTQYFERFIARLQAGELYVQMNRAQTLAMCASDSVLAQKLGFPSQLIGLDGTAVVAHVDVENYCEYAEAAVYADNARC